MRLITIIVMTISIVFATMPPATAEPITAREKAYAQSIVAMVLIKSRCPEYKNLTTAGLDVADRHKIDRRFFYVAFEAGMMLPRVLYHLSNPIPEIMPDVIKQVREINSGLAASLDTTCKDWGERLVSAGYFLRPDTKSSEQLLLKWNTLKKDNAEQTFIMGVVLSEMLPVVCSSTYTIGDPIVQLRFGESLNLKRPRLNEVLHAATNAYAFHVNPQFAVQRLLRPEVTSFANEVMDLVEKVLEANGCGAKPFLSILQETKLYRLCLDC